MDSELCIQGKRAILSTIFNQYSEFNVNINYYQTQIDTFILNSQSNQEIKSWLPFQKVQFDVGDPVYFTFHPVYLKK